ncbi:MAG: hypothetical protein IJ583_11245 [Firmicutes bacterium]|nr:hypothetical protein [Bacillota bacterium]
MKKYISKIISFLFACAVIILLMNISNGNISFKSGPDILTSATVKNKGEKASLPGVKGNFTVLINNDRVPVGTVDFFTGKSNIMPGGIKCSVAYNDEKAENFLKQIGISDFTEGDAMLMISKAEYENFDVIVFSKKTADIYTAKSLYDKGFVTAVEIKGE